MAETMRAVVKTRPEKGAELLTRSLPRIAEDEVLVKVRATSICGTDVHIYEWNDWAENRIGSRALPQVLGHEVAGEVVEVGSHVKRIKKGDYISAETHIYHPGDLQSLMGQFHVGDRMRIVGVDADGCFAEYFAVPESVCWVNDPSIPPELASVQEPLGNAVYAVLGEDYDVAGRSMAIMGDGPIALLATAVARACGVTQIFLVGMSDFNMGLARQLGADHVLDIKDARVNPAEYVRDHTYGAGADIVLEMVGAAQAIQSGFDILRRGGRFTAFGIGPASVPLDYNNGIVFKGAQVHGITGRKIFDTWYRVRNLLASGRIDIRPVITHLFPLEGFAEGFEALTAQPRHAGKVVLFPDPAEYEAAKKRLAEYHEEQTLDTGC